MVVNFKPDNNYQTGGTATPSMIWNPDWGEDPYAPPPQYLSQPMPPDWQGPPPPLMDQQTLDKFGHQLPVEERDKSTAWLQQYPNWAEENWVKNPAFEEWRQQPPMARPATSDPQPPYMPGPQPPQQQIERGEPRALSIEDRNAAIIDIMSGQAAPPELIDWYGRPKTIRPFGGTYTARDIGETPGEIVGQQPLEDVTPVTSAQAADPTTITEDAKSIFPTVTAAQRVELENTQAAQLLGDEISPEISVEEADVIGSVSAISIAEEQIESLDPKATVKAQLESLYESIIEGQPLPPWASGPVRVASQIMQQRGLGASSIAGAALVQAIQEGAIPIAAADAQKYATIQIQNLNNKQQTALSNAATYAAMDQRNQDARMRAAIQNSQNFLTIDTANLTNEQATETINFQADVQEMFTDQASENATRQFNATGKIQVDEFFAELGSKVRTRNSELATANAQFNSDQVNAVKQFNQQVVNDRDKFEANLSTQISQSNAVWRRSINTSNNATQNEANRINAQAVLGMNEIAQANLWQSYRDDAQFLIQTTENALQRAHQVGILSQQQDFQADQYKEAARDSTFGQIGALAGTVISNLGAIEGLFSSSEA